MGKVDNILEAYRRDCQRTKDYAETGMHLSQDQAKAKLLKILEQAAPKKISLDNIDLQEKINRVEYGKFCIAYNQALTDYLANIKQLFKGEK